VHAQYVRQVCVFDRRKGRLMCLICSVCTYGHVWRKVPSARQASIKQHLEITSVAMLSILLMSLF
jgi:hypothetical protein